MLAAVTMAISLAHAPEFPGKLHLEKEQNFTVQRIYDPGFMIGGIAEPARGRRRQDQTRNGPSVLSW